MKNDDFDLPFYESAVKMMMDTFGINGHNTQIDLEEALKLLKEAEAENIRIAISQGRMTNISIFKQTSTMSKKNLRNAYALNQEFNEYGKHYIKINKETYDLINEVSLADYSWIKHIKIPFEVCAWVCPEFKDETLSGNTIVTTKPGHLLDAEVQRSFAGLIFGYEYHGKGFVVMGNDGGRTEGWELAIFVIKACMFILAYPNCLKEGEYIENSRWILTTKKGKHKKKKRKLDHDQIPALTLVIPEEFKSLRSAHFCRPHFRVLAHPSFSRNDDGSVRVIAVKGHFKGGNLHHIEGDEKRAE